MSARYDHDVPMTDSGVEWLGEVPASWSIQRLKTTVESSRNGTWGMEPDGVDDIRCVRVADFDRPAQRVQDLDVTFRNIPEAERAGRVLRNGDLLLEKSGGGEQSPVGFVVLYDRDQPAVCSNFVARVVLAAGMHSAFWVYVHAAMYRSRLTARSIKQSTGIQNLDESSYFNELVGVPSFESQRRIADYLDRETAQIDEFISENEKLITLLGERRDSVWNRLACEAEAAGGTRPIRRVIESIVDGPFGSALTSAHYTDGGVRVIRLGNVGLFEFKDADRAFVDPEYAQELSSHSARAGDVLVAGLGDDRMPLGRACVLPDIGPAIVKADCYRVRPNAAVTADYLAWVMGAPQTRGLMRLASRGSTRERLNTSVVQAVEVPVPSIALQRDLVERFSAQTARIDEATATAREAIALAKERRSALISAAVTGKIDAGQGL